MLAGARRHRDAGRLQDAIAGYHKAQQLFGDQTAAKACREERQSLSIWLQPSLPAYGDWGMVVRAALTREPLVAMERAARLSGPTGRLAAGLAALAAGRVWEAEGTLAAVAEAAEAGSLLSVGAGLAAAVASLLRDNPEGSLALEQVSEDAERLGIPWLIRISRAALALTSKAEKLSGGADRATSPTSRWSGARPCRGDEPPTTSPRRGSSRGGVRTSGCRISGVLVPQPAGAHAGTVFVLADGLGSGTSSCSGPRARGTGVPGLRLQGPCRGRPGPWRVRGEGARAQQGDRAGPSRNAPGSPFPIPLSPGREPEPSANGDAVPWRVLPRPAGKPPGPVSAQAPRPGAAASLCSPCREAGSS